MLFSRKRNFIYLLKIAHINKFTNTNGWLARFMQKQPSKEVQKRKFLSEKEARYLTCQCTWGNMLICIEELNQSLV